MCYFVVLLRNIKLNSLFLHFLFLLPTMPTPKRNAFNFPWKRSRAEAGTASELGIRAASQHQHEWVPPPTARGSDPRAGTCCDYRRTNKAMCSDEIAPCCQKPTKPKQTQKSFISPVFIQIKWWGTTVWFSFIIEICQWRMFLELFVTLDKTAVKRITLQSPLSSTLMQKKSLI